MSDELFAALAGGRLLPPPPNERGEFFRYKRHKSQSALNFAAAPLNSAAEAKNARNDFYRAQRPSPLLLPASAAASANALAAGFPRIGQALKSLRNGLIASKAKPAFVDADDVIYYANRDSSVPTKSFKNSAMLNKKCGHTKSPSASSSAEAAETTITDLASSSFQDRSNSRNSRQSVGNCVNDSDSNGKRSSGSYNVSPSSSASSKHTAKVVRTFLTPTSLTSHKTTKADECSGGDSESAQHYNDGNIEEKEQLGRLQYPSSSASASKKYFAPGTPPTNYGIYQCNRTLAEIRQLYKSTPNFSSVFEDENDNDINNENDFDFDEIEKHYDSSLDLDYDIVEEMFLAPKQNKMPNCRLYSENEVSPSTSADHRAAAARRRISIAAYTPTQHKQLQQLEQQSPMNVDYCSKVPLPFPTSSCINLANNISPECKQKEKIYPSRRIYYANNDKLKINASNKSNSRDAELRYKNGKFSRYNLPLSSSKSPENVFDFRCESDAYDRKCGNKSYQNLKKEIRNDANATDINCASENTMKDVLAADDSDSNDASIIKTPTTTDSGYRSRHETPRLTPKNVSTRNYIVDATQKTTLATTITTDAESSSQANFFALFNEHSDRFVDELLTMPGSVEGVRQLAEMFFDILDLALSSDMKIGYTSKLTKRCGKFISRQFSRRKLSISSNSFQNEAKDKDGCLLMRNTVGVEESTPPPATVIDPRFIDNPELSDICFRFKNHNKRKNTVAATVTKQNSDKSDENTATNNCTVQKNAITVAQHKIVDATVTSDSSDRIVYAHRIVLVNASAQFRNLLKLAPSGASNCALLIEDVSYDNFKMMLEFLYGNAKLCLTHFHQLNTFFRQFEFLTQAHTYGLESLAAHCMRKILCALSLENCTQVLVSYINFLESLETLNTTTTANLSVRNFDAKHIISCDKNNVLRAADKKPEAGGERLEERYHCQRDEMDDSLRNNTPYLEALTRGCSAFIFENFASLLERDDFVSQFSILKSTLLCNFVSAFTS